MNLGTPLTKRQILKLMKKIINLKDGLSYKDNKIMLFYSCLIGAHIYVDGKVVFETDYLPLLPFPIYHRLQVCRPGLWMHYLVKLGEEADEKIEKEKEAERIHKLEYFVPVNDENVFPEYAKSYGTSGYSGATICTCQYCAGNSGYSGDSQTKKEV